MITDIVVPINEDQKRKIIIQNRIKSDMFESTNYYQNISFGFHGGSQNRSGFKLAMWSWMSALIDCLIMLSVCCFTMIIFSLLLKTPAREMVKVFFGSSNSLNIFGALYMVCFWMYLIVTRFFMGASIGEWACNLRLGQPNQRVRTTYLLKVIFRTSLIMVTGVFIIPILSLILKKDMAGEMSGIKVYSLV